MSFAQSSAVGRPSAERLQSALVRFLPLLGLFLLVSALTGPGRAPTGDEAPLIAAAHRLLDGHYAVTGTRDGTQFLWHGPGLPALIAPLVALGVPLSGLRLTGPLLMFAAALMFYRLLRLRLNPRVALIGAYALALYGPAYYVIGTLGKDPLALLLAITMLDGVARYLKYGRVHHALIAGASFAALAMTRLEYGWVILLALASGLAWWLITRVRQGNGAESTQAARRWSFVCAVALLGCVPWLVYTYSLTRHLLYWGNSGGTSLFWMSSPAAGQLGEWHASHTVFSDPALTAYRPLFHYLKTVTPLQGDLKLQHIALTQALGHPAKYALNLLANVGRMFAGFPFSFKLSIAAVVGMVLINGAILAGVIAAGARVRRARLRLPREAVPFVVFGVLVFAVHLLPSAEPRLVMLLIPVAIWLIAQAFGGGLQLGGSRGRFRAAAKASISPTA